MRRRTLLSGGSTEYVFSAQSTSVSIGYTSSWTYVNIQSTANGSNIGYSVVSYDGTVVTGVTTAETRVAIIYSENPGNDKRSGNVVLKQNDSNKTITITVSQDAKPVVLNYYCILLDGTSGSNGSSGVNCEVSFSNVPSWVTVTYSSGKINVTAKSSNSASTARLGFMTVKAGSQSTALRIIQLPSDYHSRSYVSIGGLNWAIKNVGASSVQDYGDYYMYGKGSRVYNASDSYYQGTENPLASSADTATQVMGEGWRMPTKTETQDLYNNASYFWVSYNGVNGGVYYSYSSGNVLFFPAGGYIDDNGFNDKGSYGFYWSSTPYSTISAYDLYFDYDRGNLVHTKMRHDGCSVRGVYA